MEPNRVIRGDNFLQTNIFTHTMETMIIIYFIFYIEKVRFTGFYIFSNQKHDYGYSLEPPRRGDSNVYPQSCFEEKKVKISKKKISVYCMDRVFSY